MDLVFQKTGELAEALLASEQWKTLKEAEEAFRADSRAEALLKTAQNRQQGISALQQIPDPDPMALKRLADEIDTAQAELEELDTTQCLRKAQAAFNQLIDQVNQVLQFIITGRTETSGCGGNCGSCPGCH